VFLVAFVYHFSTSVAVRNDDVRRLTKQAKLTAIIQSRRLILFGHIMRMDYNADAKRILLASPPADWRRQLGRLRITWLGTVQQDLKQHHLSVPKAADLAQNSPRDVDVWRYAILVLHSRNDDDDITVCGIGDFRRFIRISHTVTGRFSRHQQNV